MITLRPDQLDFVERIRAAYRSGAKSVLGCAPTGMGKCLGRGTPVMLYSGHIVPVESIIPGDVLMGPDSGPRIVRSTTRGVGPLYRVTPTKGDPYIVNDAHILSLKITSGARAKSYPDGSIQNISVMDYLTRSSSFRHCAKGWRVGVEFSEHNDPPLVDPYFLGLWLGDGNSLKPTVTTGDDEIIAFCKSHFASLGMMTRIEQNSANSVNIHGLRKPGSHGRANPLLDALRSIDVIGNKHIPHRYLTGSRDERLAVLAGILDSDGYHANGVFDVVLKSERLFDGLPFLARSLGFAAYKSKVRKRCCNNGVVGDYFRCCISGNTDAIPTIVARNRAAKRRQTKDVLLTGIKVEPIGDGEYFGFEIDGDRLFLLGDFTVTHNTVVSAYIARAAVEKKSRVLFTVHRTELMHQTGDTFTAFGISHGFIKSGMVYDPNHLVHIASIDTLRNRLEKIPAPDLLVVDECHLARAAGWHKIIACCRENGARVLGNSGSPHRLDGKSLGDLFDALVVGPSTADLIAAGHLSRFRYFAPNSPDMTGARKQLGDYTTADASAAVDIPSITGNIVGHWKKYAQGMRTICFTISHKHSDHIIEAFRGAGVTAEQISSKTPPVERKRLINAFADGEISVLCNVELITTGFDLAAQVGRDVTVEAVIMARPTMSLALYLQMVGRALRRKPNPAVILDHAGNSARHGFPDEIREWSLDGENKSKAKKKTQPPVTCETCFSQCCRPLPPHCPHCGTPWPEAEMRPIVVDETAELVEISEADRRLADARKKHEVSRCQSLEELAALGAQRGYKPGWAQHIWQARKARRS